MEFEKVMYKKFVEFSYFENIISCIRELQAVVVYGRVRFFYLMCWD
jgi:hypothetical protein